MSRLSQMLVHEQRSRGLTERAAAEEIGCLQQTFGSWKRGTIPRPHVFDALANWLRISPDMMAELAEEARQSAGNTKLPKLTAFAQTLHHGKVTDRKEGKFRFTHLPAGRYSVQIDTKVMEPALLVGTKAWLDPAVWPRVGHEVMVFAKGGNAWLGRLAALDGDRAELTRENGGPVSVTDVQAVHVVVLSERI